MFVCAAVELSYWSKYRVGEDEVFCLKSSRIGFQIVGQRAVCRQVLTEECLHQRCLVVLPYVLRRLITNVTRFLYLFQRRKVDSTQCDFVDYMAALFVRSETVTKGR